MDITEDGKKFNTSCDKNALLLQASKMWSEAAEKQGQYRWMWTPKKGKNTTDLLGAFNKNYCIFDVRACVKLKYGANDSFP